MAHQPVGWRLLTKAEHKDLGIPYTRRLAEDPEGHVVPYNQYLNAQARQSGFRSHADYRKHAKMLSVFRSSAMNPNKLDLSLGSQGLFRLKTELVDKRGADTVAGGSLARLLEDMGIRAAGATYDVGDTP